MSDSSITIESPFPLREVPALFCWVDRIRNRIADDLVPDNLEDWMAYQQGIREDDNSQTWGIYKSGELGGYLHAITMNPFSSENPRVSDELRWIAQCEIIFKTEVWGFLARAQAPMNLAIRTVFDMGIETAFFPIFTANRVVKGLFESVGGISMGAITPRKQNGVEIPTEMYCFTVTQWEAKNPAFVSLVNPNLNGGSSNEHSSGEVREDVAVV